MRVTNAVLRGRSSGTCLCACDEGPAILHLSPKPQSLQEGSQGKGSTQRAEQNSPWCLPQAEQGLQPRLLCVEPIRGAPGRQGCTKGTRTGFPGPACVFCVLWDLSCASLCWGQRCVLSPELCKGHLPLLQQPCASMGSEAKGWSLIPRSDSNSVEFYSSPKPSGRD